uniref:FHA domain-containing protein n=1 Tax=uncultured bacterium contig00040 TaxID=1181528 RepID=A0A806K0I3_9BACT|nr:hypothetical protein [uncultured bacterium contig00040]
MGGYTNIISKLGDLDLGDLGDLGGLGDLLGGLGDLGALGRALEVLGKLVPFYSVIFVILGIGILVSHYVLNSLTVRNIGRKAGLTKDWMAFVPFTRAVYRLQTIGEKAWKMFFLEYWGLYAFLISWFFDLFNNSTMTIFGGVLAALFALAQLAYRIYYRHKFCKTFGIKSELAISIVTGWGTMPWGIAPLTKNIDTLIAFTPLLDYQGQQAAASLTQAIRQQPQQLPNLQYAPPAAPVGAPAYGPAPAAASGQCSLTGMSGMYAGQNIPMAPNDELLIGRDATMANIILDQNADKVSRKHCGIRYDAGRGVYMVTDYSSNGTFIDGGSRLVANVPTAMQRGTVIALGNRENRFRLN